METSIFLTQDNMQIAREFAFLVVMYVSIVAVCPAPLSARPL